MELGLDLKLRSWSWNWSWNLRSWNWSWSWNLRSWSWSWSWYSGDLPELELELELKPPELELELIFWRLAGVGVGTSGVGVGVGVDIMELTPTLLFRTKPLPEPTDGILSIKPKGINYNEILNQTLKIFLPCKDLKMFYKISAVLNFWSQFINSHVSASWQRPAVHRTLPDAMPSSQIPHPGSSDLPHTAPETTPREQCGLCWQPYVELCAHVGLCHAWCCDSDTEITWLEVELLWWLQWQADLHGALSGT